MRMAGHKGHEERSVTLIESLCDRLKLSSEYRELSTSWRAITATCIVRCELRPNTILEFWKRPTRFRRPVRFAQALLASSRFARRLGLENTPYPQRQYLQAARDAAATIKTTPEDIGIRWDR